MKIWQKRKEYLKRKCDSGNPGKCVTIIVLESFLYFTGSNEVGLFLSNWFFPCFIISCFIFHPFFSHHIVLLIVSECHKQHEHCILTTHHTLISSTITYMYVQLSFIIWSRSTDLFTCPNSSHNWWQIPYKTEDAKSHGFFVSAWIPCIPESSNPKFCFYHINKIKGNIY